MRFENYLTEFSKDKYGAGITFIDIDETVFKTFSKILVMKDGKEVHALNNVEYNAYKLKDGESFDFHQFRDAKIFNKTSIPIPRTVERIKKMLAHIKASDSASKIVFLTARADFDDKKEFLDTFEKHGINMDRPTVYVERTGNMKTGTVEERKKKVILGYLKSGEYRRVRLLDDFLPNLKALKELEKELPKAIEDKVIARYNLDMENEKIPVISFYALLVKPDGSLKQV